MRNANDAATSTSPVVISSGSGIVAHNYCGSEVWLQRARICYLAVTVRLYVAEWTRNPSVAVTVIA